MRLLLPSSSSSSSSPARALVVLRLQVCRFSSSSPPPSPSHHHYSRRFDEESRNVRVSVWWDFENCQVPGAVTVSKVAPAIMEAVRANGIKGPIHISGYGDLSQLSRFNQEALHYTGIHLSHVPNGGKNSADISLLADLMLWVSQNPPPAHLFLISGDKVFAGMLHRLRMNNYNILLAIPGKAPPDVLCSAATITWQWSSLLKGEDLIGRHFNHPPDGPFGSWYGNQKVPLENPFSSNRRSASLQNVEVCEPTAESKPGPVPQSVVRKVTHVLSSHPEGIAISNLRQELAKNNVYMDKLFYGYKRFSSFLLSMPHIQLKPLGDGQFCVRLTPSKSPEPSASNDGPSTESVVKIEKSGLATTQKLNDEGKTMARDTDGTHSMVSMHESSSENAGNVVGAQLSATQLPLKDNEVSKSKVGFLKTSSKNFPDNEIVWPGDVSPNISGKYTVENQFAGNDYTMVESDAQSMVVDAQLSATQLPLKDNEVSKSKVDFLKTSSKKSPDNEIVRPGDVSPNISGKYTTENHFAGNDYTMVESDESRKTIAEDKYEMPTRKDVDEVCDSSYSFPIDDSVVDKRPGGSAETYSKSRTFSGWIKSWWPWKSGAKSDDLTTHQTRVVSQSEEPKSSQLDETVSHSKELKLSEPDQTVSHAEEPKLSDEQPKLSELDQTLSHSKELKLSEPDQTVSHAEGPKLSDEQPNLSELDQTVGHSEKHELFSKASFWNDMESFVFTSKGSLLCSLSTSREDLIHKLQKDGPQVLSSLTEKDILQLVDLLITDKRWLEESPSQAYPFRLTQLVKKSSLAGASHATNGLRSLFLSRTPQSSSQKSFDHDVEEHNQNIPHTGISTPATETKYDDRSRNDMLADCQKLLNEKLREHPEGINMGLVRKLFVERYGYHLDLQKLGYKRLASLLQTMPGVKLESSYIFPSTFAVCDTDQETSILKTQVTTNASDAVSNSDSELSDSASKDDNTDSPWEELGPVSVNNSNQSDLESQSSQKTRELDTSRYPDYEPADSYYDSSESDGDSNCSTQTEKQRKPKFDEQDCSLWRVLDSYHNSKEGENSVKKSDNENTFSNSLADILSSSAKSSQATLSKLPSGRYREKQKSRKNYSFVADPSLPEKEKLIDGILDGFKKADESKMPY